VSTAIIDPAECRNAFIERRGHAGFVGDIELDYAKRARRSSEQAWIRLAHRRDDIPALFQEQLHGRFPIARRTTGNQYGLHDQSPFGDMLAVLTETIHSG
jgi:hypothetical protein